MQSVERRNLLYWSALGSFFGLGGAGDVERWEQSIITTKKGNRIMIELGFTKTKEYKKILEVYLEALNQLAKYQQWSTIKDKVDEDMQQRQGELAKMYREYKANRIAENEAKMTEIEKRFKNSRNVYDNPQAELLRRQDFDMELELMDAYQVKEMLEDPNRDFSKYELKKIETLYKDNMGIYAALQNRVPEEDAFYLNNPEYSRMNEENNILRTINNMGLSIFYVPDSESLDDYQYLDLNLVGQPYNVISGYTRLEEISRLLRELDKAISSARSGLVELTKQEVQAPRYEFKEFDERIFRGSANFDTTVRFKYLKERYDDTTTDRWDFRRDDYDVMAHYEFLERKLEMKMKRDPEFARRYRSAESVATYQSPEEVSRKLANGIAKTQGKPKSKAKYQDFERSEENEQTSTTETS